MRKVVLRLLLSLAVLMIMPGCGIAIGDDRTDKEDIFEFVCEMEEQLRNAIDEGDFSAFENQGFIKGIHVEETAVEFNCGGAGFGPETAYIGFYFTPDDDMTAVWCAPSSADLLTPYEDGFEWKEEKGDNRYYTQRICENFYYYEASY